VLQGGKPP